MTARHAVDDRAETLFENLKIYSRPALFTILGAAVLGGGALLYNQSKAKNAARADQALVDVQRTLGAGNLPLAESDLRKLVQRYEGTPSSVQATLLLAQLQYDQGKPADGLKLLQAVEGDRAGRTYRASIEALIAAGLEQQGKPADAAKRYEQAAQSARFELDRAGYLADAARAYMAAGNKAEARRLWTQLSADPAGPVAGEARVRLGELNAQPAS